MKKFFSDKKVQKIFCAAVIAIGSILMFMAGKKAYNDMLISLPLLIILFAGIFAFVRKGERSKGILFLPFITALIFAVLNIFAALAFNLDPTLTLPDGSYPVSGYINVFFRQIRTLCIGAVLSAVLFIAGTVKNKHKTTDNAHLP